MGKAAMDGRPMNPMRGASKKSRFASHPVQASTAVRKEMGRMILIIHRNAAHPRFNPFRAPSWSFARVSVTIV
jgi:hypothetical protein